jgi:GTP-binding protein EngB required for normal cell division
MIRSIQKEPIGFIDDFDIPFISVRDKYPKLKKKQRAKKRVSEEGEEDDED